MQEEIESIRKDLAKCCNPLAWQDCGTPDRLARRYGLFLVATQHLKALLEKPRRDHLRAKKMAYFKLYHLQQQSLALLRHAQGSLKVRVTQPDAFRGPSFSGGLMVLPREGSNGSYNAYSYRYVGCVFVVC